MKKFEYTVKEANGIHARPAGLLVKAAKELDSTITLENVAGKAAAATKLMAVMGLGIKQGETVTVTVEGGDEEASATAMKKFFNENL
jgi:phosphocarrier protein HPr